MTTEVIPSIAMVVVAHPDDADWGCSGSVAHWAQQGSKVIYVICTDGSKGSDDPEMTPDRRIRTRKAEHEAAGRVLGLHKVVFLDYEDAMLEPSLDLRRDLVRQIRRYKPDTLICGSPVRTFDGTGYLGHPDHQASAEAALAAVFPAARDRLTFPELLEEGLDPHKVSTVLIMQPSVEANRWVDVTATMDIALEALMQHVSQIDPEGAERNMRYWRKRIGKTIGVEYAEAFRAFQLD